MPANVSTEFAKAQKKYHEARSLEEKFSALREMQRFAPAHKGGENLRAEISRKLKALREKMEKQEEQRKKTSAKGLSVKKEGIGQIVLVGLPNTGKSSILKALTNADVEIANYPFTTKKPEVGMIDFENSRIQLVEIPPIIEGSSSGKASGNELLSIVRTADAVVLVLDSIKPFKDFELLKRELENVKIIIDRKKPRVKIGPTKFKGIFITGEKFFKGKKLELESFLKSQGIFNASVVLSEPVDIPMIEEVLDKSIVYKPCIALVVDSTESGFNEAEMKKIARFLKVLRVQKLDEKTVQQLKSEFFLLLGKILVFTKKPGEAKAKKPLALEKNATVEDLVRFIHKDIARSFKFARVWGSTRFPGQKVAKDYVLKNHDVVEVYC